MSSIERTPEIHDAAVLYQTDGTANKIGGVEMYANNLAAYVESFGIDPWLLMGEGPCRTEIADTMDGFDPQHIRTVRERYPGVDDPRGVVDALNKVMRLATGAENSLSAWPDDDTRIWLRRLQPDIAHSMHPWQPQHGGRINKMLRKVSADTLHVGTYHIDADDRATNFVVGRTGDFNRRQLNRFDAFTAVSRTARDHAWRTGYHRGDMQIIPNSVDVGALELTREFDPEEIKERGVPEADKYIVFVGRPDDRKGLKELIDATKELNGLIDSNTRVQVVVCGEGPDLATYQKHAHDSGVDNVSFMGRVSHDDKARWLKTADFAVFPAKYGESQGIVLLEAMAAGSTVVFAGNAKGYAETVEELPSSDFITFDPKDPLELAKRIHAVIGSDAFAQELHIEQQKLVRVNFDASIVGHQVLRLYGNLLGV